MQITGINPINNTLTQNIKKTENGNSGFNSVLKSAIEMFNDTNELQKKAEQASLDFAMGKTDSIHEVMYAQEKANIALQFTVEIRNKVLEAYNEIMRMQL